MKLFFANILLALVWASMTGEMSLANLLVGAVIGYLVLLILRPILGPSDYFRKLPQTIVFTGYFIREMLLSSLRVGYDVITPTHYSKPGIIAIPLDARTDIEITLLANLISLTPGTLSLDLSPDRSKLYIHAMFAADPDRLRADIKATLEKPLLDLMR
ncbi:MAG TPA: Na+/H+ antiporter subunit E [Kiritimatiellia bacterium]|nr:Na+/H+ antiporter subunit E [Kiritimatiellia bacterium]